MNMSIVNIRELDSLYNLVKSDYDDIERNRYNITYKKSTTTKNILWWRYVTTEGKNLSDGPHLKLYIDENKRMIVFFGYI